VKLIKSLIIPDCHFPFVNQKAYDLCLEAGYDVDVDEVVILGDYGDFYCINSHGKRPGLSDLLEYEVDCVKKELTYLREMFPKAKIIFLQGNHEYRLERYIQNNAPELFGMLSCQKLFEVDKLKIHWIPYSPAQKYAVGGGKLLARHEPLAGTATATASKAGQSVIYGHIHRIEESQVVHINGDNHRAISCGWLGDQSHEVMQYVKNHHQWALGFALVYTLPDGTFFVETKHIINNSIILNGEVLKI